MLKSLNNWLDIFEITSNDVDISLTEIEHYEEYLTKKEPHIFLINNPSKGDIEAIKLLKDSDLQFRYRSYVRTVFSYFEANIWGITQIILEDNDNISLKATDILLLEEKREVELNGKVELKTSRLEFSERVKETLKIFTKISQNKIDLDFGVKEWELFKNGIKTRDRITHPKTTKDLLIKKEEILQIADAYNWFNILLTSLFKNL